MTRASRTASRRPPRPRGRTILWLAFLLTALAATGPARAVICTVDAVPAATLLLPYFEVNLDDPNGLTTLFSVNNASATAVLAHAVVWSDLGVPVLNFTLYLTGYDVQTLNLRDLLVHGGLPRTASAGQDPLDTLSPKGVYSQDINFASCQQKLPPPPMSADELAHAQAALTGRPSALASNLCFGQSLGDRIARGYITVDTVNNCTPRVPGDPHYFGNGDATDQNVLWGTWYIVDSVHDYAQGSDLVAIEASASDPATSTSGRYTFYGRYDGWSAADHREPLATSFAAQFAVPQSFGGTVDLIVWRDPKIAQAPFPCPATGGSRPPWYPLEQEGFTIFDEEEHPVLPIVFPFTQPPQPVPIPFPAATQRSRVGGAQLPVPYNFGWLELDLNTSSTAAVPPFDPQAAQAWVLYVQSATGRFATAIDAFRLDSACAPNHHLPNY
jgi:hypothetical protein